MDESYGTKHTEGLADEKDRFVSAVTATFKTILKPFSSSGREAAVEWDESDVYCDSIHQGVAVVIINEKFRDHKGRTGCQLDERNLCGTFSSLGFEVRLVRDCSVQELKRVLSVVAKEDHSAAESFVLAMSSHGDEYIHSQESKHHTRQIREDVVFCTDFYMTTRQLLQYFSDANCPSLKGKPRLFFLQACRGSQLDAGQQIKVTRSKEEMGADEVDGTVEKEVFVSPTPCFKDCLIMYATPPGYYAFRRPTDGSWFVQALCSVFEKCDGSKSILQVLTSVIRLVAQEYISCTPASTETDRKKQTPCIYSMLTKDLFLKVVEKKGRVLTWQ